MTYQLPEPVHLIVGYTAAQMQAAYAAGVAAERERIASEWDGHLYGDCEDIDIGGQIRGEDMSDLSALRGIQGVGL
jgi:hypothetical protein